MRMMVDDRECRGWSYNKNKTYCYVSYP